jgi:hypothetical protein
MRYLIVPAILIGLVSATSAAAASNSCSNDMSMRADASLAGAAGAWGSLLKHWRAFTSCDDGGVAEGYSDAVVVLLARRWDQFDAFVSLSERNPAFRKWAIGHIDATTSSDDLKRVLRNTERCAGSAKRKGLCREIARAARDALKD